MQHGIDCACCPAAAVQSLDEVSFSKSICAAASVGDTARVKALLQKNPAAVHSDGTEQGGSGYTPLHYAARGCHLSVLQLLLDFGADPNAATSAGGATALHRAAFMGHTTIVACLLDAGAHPQHQDADGQTPLHKAVQQGHEEVAQLLLGKDASLADIHDAKGRRAADLKSG